MFSHIKQWFNNQKILPFIDVKEHPLGVKDILIIIVIIFATTLLGELFHVSGFSDVTIITLYILAVQVIAIRISGRISNVVMSLICVVVFNFFFTDPKYTLLAYDPDYPITFVVMFIVAFLAGTIADQLKGLARQSERTLYRTQILLDTSQLLSKAHEEQEIAEVIGIQVHKLLDKDTEVTIPGDSGADKYWYFPDDCAKSFQNEMERSAAKWAMQSGNQTGGSAPIYKGAKGVYYPILQNGNIYGIVGVITGAAAVDSFSENILHSILNQCGLAMENIRTLKEKEAEALKAQNEKLRSDLLRAISHDLRTPLTAISGNASILMQSADNFDEETRQQVYADIYDDSIWLVNLVENLLAVSRAINGTMQLRCTTELLDDVIDAALQHIDRHADEHHIQFHHSNDMILARMDVHLIEQVVINLINNAIKYTPKDSEITISTRIAGKKAIVTIEDDGDGIAPEDLPHLFEMFYNGKKNIADASKSLGIGLALCKSIIEAHGGVISVSNRKPHGACFVFSLPIEEVTLNET